jgi:DNA-binding GntR family transcriptional regulator
VAVEARSAPLWRAIAVDLRNGIIAGDYAAGQPLPSEAVLARRFDTSRPTVRRAITDLVGDGLITVVHGRGTFVTDDAVIRVPSQVKSRLETAAQQRGLTLGELLEEYARLTSDAVLMEQAAAEQVRLQESDPRAWAEYLAEADEWEQGTTDQLTV